MQKTLESVEPEDVWAMALGSLLPLAGLLATPICLLITVLGFDGTPGAWAGAVLLVSLPILSLISLAAGWTLLGFRKLRAAQAMIVAPLAWIAIFLAAWLSHPSL